MRSSTAKVALLGVAFVDSVLGHEHHDDKIPEGMAISPDPLDSTLWIHILVQIVAWGIIFPTGMVLGVSFSLVTPIFKSLLILQMVRSRWHVPLQIVGAVLAIVAYFLGHAHKGRQFAPNIHAMFANTLGFILAVQLILGIYLKLHLEKGINGRVRRYIVIAHGILGKFLPVISWTQMLFGGITAMGFCRDDHMGQCLAHFIMGSAFIGYGIILTTILLAGQLWLRRTGRSQEFFDSLIIALWGCVNTFTEHRWGQAWRKNDIQHTSMGVIWWCAGLLGMWLSKKRNGAPKRNLIPGLVIVLTGWAMGGHPQDLELSTHIHTVFGYTLMAAGGARIIEISFVLKDRPSISKQHVEEVNSFQYVTPFLLFASGFLFMGATEEQMALLTNMEITHVSYVLLLYSIAFLLFLFVNVLLHIYASYVWPIEKKSTGLPKDEPAANRRTNGMANGGLATMDRERIRDAEEFELTGLISDNEDTSEGSASGRQKEAV